MSSVWYKTFSKYQATVWPKQVAGTLRKNISLWIYSPSLTAFLQVSESTEPAEKLLFLKVVHLLEAVDQKCSIEKVFLKISQNSQENTCARASSLIKLQP